MKRTVAWLCMLCCVCLISSYALTKKQCYGSVTDNISVWKVQKEIKIGMISAEVVEVLGSPNMVTTDGQRREVCVYDKVSTQILSVFSSKGLGLLVGGAGSSVGGVAGVGAGRGKSSTSTSQRTLTVIIKFDNGGKVIDFSYRTSSFWFL